MMNLGNEKNPYPLWVKKRHFLVYRTCAKKGRTYYSNEIFLEIAAANNQERL